MARLLYANPPCLVLSALTKNAVSPKTSHGLADLDISLTESMQRATAE